MIRLRRGGEADRAVIGLVGDTGDHPYGERACHHYLGPVPADRAHDVAAQVGAVLHHAVAMVEEVHRVHADLAGSGPLLGLAQRSGLGGMQTIDARFATGGEKGYVTCLP